MILFLTILAVVISVVYLQPRWSLTVLARRHPDVLYFVQTTKRVVALTIDDAPHPLVTPQILDVLRAHGAHATFFVLGDHVRGNEHILEHARREGHELGNHLEHDYPSIRLTPTVFEQQLRIVDQLIAPSTKVKWFRPGSGWYNSRMLAQAREQRYRCALGSVYPFDTIVRNEWLISKYITSQVFPGAVIILHDGNSDRIRSVNVLRNVLPSLRRSGYDVVTLSELEGRLSTT